MFFIILSALKHRKALSLPADFQIGLIVLTQTALFSFRPHYLLIEIRIVYKYICTDIFVQIISRAIDLLVQRVQAIQATFL